MLILTRKLGETIRIGDEITINVVDIKGKQVRLGIEAPPEVIVHREEIYRHIQEQNMLAVQAGGTGDSVLDDLWRRVVKKEEAE